MNPHLALVVEQVQITALHEDPANVRRHDRKNLDAIKASLKRFGQQKPIVVDAGGVVRAGNGTLAAAKELGWSTIAAVRTNLSGCELTAYAIADNRSAELAAWDDEGLAKLLSELRAEDAALLASTGFSDEEFQKLLNEAIGGLQTFEDEVPELSADAISAIGDLWCLGQHKVMVGDATKTEDLKRLMGTEKAAMLWSDPPYGVSYVGGTGLKIANDDAKGLPALLRASFANVAAALAPGAPVYIAHPTGPLSLEFAKAVVDAGWHWHESLVWCKDALVLGHSDYQHRHEGILYAWAPGAKRPWYAGRDQTTVFEIPRPKASPDHPTSKPIELIAVHLRNSSSVGALVIDPFLGSGSTLIACEQLGRRCVGLEIDPRYADVVVRRWQRVSGKRAKNGTRPEVEIA